MDVEDVRLDAYPEIAPGHVAGVAPVCGDPSTVEQAQFASRNAPVHTLAIRRGCPERTAVASATSFALSPEYAEKMNREAARNREYLVTRPLQISNSPEVIRRMGLIASNGMIEADIYGNINSTHVSGTRLMNGIGGSDDFTRNAFASTFISPSVAKDGAISAVVPFASHIDHTEHDAMVVITEDGYADLRGLAPRDRVAKMISVAHPDYRPLLEEYYQRAATNSHLHTPHDLPTAFSFHGNLAERGSMKATG